MALRSSGQATRPKVSDECPRNTQRPNRGFLSQETLNTIEESPGGPPQGLGPEGFSVGTSRWTRPEGFTGGTSTRARTRGFVRGDLHIGSGPSISPGEFQRKWPLGRPRVTWLRQVEVFLREMELGLADGPFGGLGSIVGGWARQRSAQTYAPIPDHVLIQGYR